MKRYLGYLMRFIALTLVTAMVSGCLAVQHTPSATLISEMRTITIVPIEAPPLLMHPHTDDDRSAITALGLSSPGPGGLGYSPLGPIGVMLITSIPHTGETTGMVKESSPWMPTTGLARIATRLLQGLGAREVFLADGYAQLPIADRSISTLLENWMSAERRWYNAGESMLDYMQLGVPRTNIILEVGVMNYEYIGNHLVLQVFVKLTDPTTRKVLGRARNADYVKAEPLARMLQDNGQLLRSLIEAIGEALLTKCLKDLGLMTR